MNKTVLITDQVRDPPSLQYCFGSSRLDRTQFIFVCKSRSSFNKIFKHKF